MKVDLPFDWTNPHEAWFLSDVDFHDCKYGASAVKYVDNDKPEHNLRHGDCFGIIFQISKDAEEDIPIAYYKCEGSADAINFVEEAESDYRTMGEELFLKDIDINT